MIGNLKKNAENAQHIVGEVVERLAKKAAEGGLKSIAHSALKDALMTPEAAVPYLTKRKLAAIIGKYMDLKGI